MKRPLDIASSGHRAQNQLAMNDPPPVLIDLHSASSRRESQNAFRRRKKGTVATRPHSSALGHTSGPPSALKLARRMLTATGVRRFPHGRMRLSRYRTNPPGSHWHRSGADPSGPSHFDRPKSGEACSSFDFIKPTCKANSTPVWAYRMGYHLKSFKLKNAGHPIEVMKDIEYLCLGVML